MLSFRSKTLVISYGSLPKKLLYSVTFLLTISIIAFSVFYLASDYEKLKLWYYSLNDCFPDRETWTTNFFTLWVKLRGDKFAILAIILSVALMVYIIMRWKKLTHLPTQKKEIIIEQWWWYGAVKILAISLAIWSWSLAAPAYDEIYSAVNCAELHPFQTLSYYMIPNNHIYYNFINNIFFGWYSDHVQSGRFISLIAYVCILLCAFRWLVQLIGDHKLAFIALLPIAMQLSALGFSAQARGYESQLLCGWIAFLTMVKYIQSGNRGALLINTLVNIIGFALIPSYLYWYVAQILTVLCVAAYNRRFEISYFKYQVLLGVGVFLLYLPALCFSGVGAFTSNPFVRAAYKDWIAFLPDFAGDFKFFMNYCFSSLCGEDRAINFALFLLPLILFLSKRKERRFLGFFYVIFWSAFIVTNLNMRHPPFNRNLIIHYNLTMALVVYTFYVIIESIAGQRKIMQYSKPFMLVFFIIPVLIFCGHLIKSDKTDVATILYFNKANEIYKDHIEDINTIPKGSSIAFSYSSFYFYYYCRKLHYNASRCANGNEEYFVNYPVFSPVLPDLVIKNYVFVRKFHEDYDLYKRK